jgi:hypothetical protein
MTSDCQRNPIRAHRRTQPKQHPSRFLQILVLPELYLKRGGIFEQIDIFLVNVQVRIAQQGQLIRMLLCQILELGSKT